MIFKMKQLVCVLVPFFKNVAFFCGDCGGCGQKGSLQLPCSRCHGNGLRIERMRALKFGGVARVQNYTGDGGRDAVYTVVMPQMWDVREDNTDRTRDVSVAYWDQVERFGTAYNTITAQVPVNHIFTTYLEMMNRLPFEKKAGIEAEIVKLGGDPTTFQEDPEKIPTAAQMKSREKARLNISKNDFVTSVVYRSSVQKYFKCEKCDGTNTICDGCYGGGKEAIYVPQYTIEGVVKVTQVVNNFVEYLVPPIMFVNNEKHVVHTTNYWHDGFGAINAPKAGQGTMDLLFTTSKAALEWLEKKNRTLLLEWSSLHRRIPLNEDGNPMIVAHGASNVSDKYPEPVAIEACLR